MPTFFLDIEAIPTSAAAGTSEIASASILMFVIADSKPEAEARARAMIIEHAWITTDIPLFLQLTEAQLSRLDANMYSAYEQALKHGIGCLFIVYPRDEDVPNDPVEYYTFSSPAFNSHRKH